MLHIIMSKIGGIVMKKNIKMANLIFEMEYLVGRECYNPNSYDGYTGGEGCSFRYPVYILEKEGDQDLSKHWGTISGVAYKNITTMKYKFGSNHLFIGNSLIAILEMLEDRYGIDFDELEKQRHDK